MPSSFVSEVNEGEVNNALTRPTGRSRFDSKVRSRVEQSKGADAVDADESSCSVTAPDRKAHQAPRHQPLK